MVGLHTFSGAFTLENIHNMAYAMDEVAIAPTNVFFQFNASGENFIEFLKMADKELGFKQKDDEVYNQFLAPAKQRCDICIHKNVCKNRKVNILEPDSCEDYLANFNLKEN